MGWDYLHNEHLEQCLLRRKRQKRKTLLYVVVVSCADVDADSLPCGGRQDLRDVAAFLAEASSLGASSPVASSPVELSSEASFLEESSPEVSFLEESFLGASCRVEASQDHIPESLDPGLEP